MSPSRSVEPSASARTMMSRNCSAVCRRSWAVMVALICWPSMAGVPPSWPTATWAFWAWMAATTSDGASW
jgi:hypothetical protein